MRLTTVWGLFPPIAVRASSGGRDPQALGHEPAGVHVPPAQRDHDPERLGPGQEPARPPAPQALSSPAARNARAMSSTGSGRSVIGTPGSGRSVTWPTPTRTGVRGSRATEPSVPFGPGEPPGRREGPRYASPMRIAVGSDHAGYLLKEFLAAHLAELGHEVDDLGTDSEQAVDYPEFGAAVGRAVTEGRAQLGLCACGTGIGIAIAANKIHGVRAAVVHDVTTARLARAHNHANVVCMGGRIVGHEVAKDAIDTFLSTAPVGGRHEQRIEEIAVLEAR